MKSPRGFTLVELMVAITIVGVLAALSVDVTSATATPSTSSDKVAGMLGYARIRTLATRTIHRVQVESQTVSLWRATTTGLSTPVGWQRLQIESIPKPTKIWNAQTSVQVTLNGGPVENPAVLLPIDFKPDGTTTGATIFVTDSRKRKMYRVMVYRATGGTYIREGW
ncbi:MAG: prepilin-type N-terminal cleavage/methylation domain-containing protein [Kofleriaceae bacterium]